MPTDYIVERPKSPFKSCHYAENCVIFYRNRIAHCCIPVDGKFGDTTICPYDGGALPTAEVLKSRERYRTAINDLGHHPEFHCNGCSCIATGNWDNPYLVNNLHFNHSMVCNLRCNFCVQRGTPIREQMPGYPLLPVVQQIIAEEWMAPDTYIFWAGGEPCLLEDFNECLELMLAQPTRNEIATNGTIYSPVIHKNLDTHGKLVLKCSVDCGTPETYISLKKRDYFDRVWDNLGKYASSGGEVSAKYIVSNDNCNKADLDGFVHKCVENGIRYSHIDINHNFPHDQVYDRHVNASLYLYNRLVEAGVKTDIGVHSFASCPDFRDRVRKVQSDLKSGAIAQIALEPFDSSKMDDPGMVGRCTCADEVKVGKKAVVKRVQAKTGEEIQLYAHIGASKTGSTAIQEFFDVNRKVLADNKVVLYPNLRQGDPLDGGHWVWMQPLFKEPESTWVARFQRVKNFCEDGGLKKVVVSMETPANKKYRQGLKSVRDSLGFNVKIVIYIRRQDLWLESSWKQWACKSDLYVDFEDYVKHVLKGEYLPGLEERLEYYDVLKEWEDIFGPENIIVRVYEKEHMPYGVLSDFFFVLGLGEQIRKLNLDVHSKPNPGFSRELLALQRLCRRLCSGPHDLHLTNMFYALLNESYFQKPHSNYNLMSRDLRQEVLDHFAEQNAAVAREYLGNLDGQLFKNYCVENFDDAEPYELTMQDSLPILIDMIDSLYKNRQADSRRITALEGKIAYLVQEVGTKKK